MEKEHKYFLGGLGLIFSLILIYYLSFYGGGLNNNSNISANTSTGKELSIQTKEVKDTKKIDYDVNIDDLALNKVSENKDIYLSGSNISVNGKSFSGSFINLINTDIKNDGKNYYINSESIGGKDAKEVKDVKIEFVKGLSKMKLLGEYYDFDSKNIKTDNTYDLSFFVTNNNKNYYVLTFENYTEKKKRAELFSEYNNYISETQKKYWDNPAKMNELVKEANKKYNIDISKLN